MVSGCLYESQAAIYKSLHISMHFIMQWRMSGTKVEQRMCLCIDSKQMGLNASIPGDTLVAHRETGFNQPTHLTVGSSVCIPSCVASVVLWPPRGS